jgi:hypothetical protein
LSSGGREWVLELHGGFNGGREAEAGKGFDGPQNVGTGLGVAVRQFRDARASLHSLIHRCGLSAEGAAHATELPPKNVRRRLSGNQNRPLG